jgi:hypothetical protein
VLAVLVSATGANVLPAQRGDLTVDLALAGAATAIATGTNAAFDVRVTNRVNPSISGPVLVRVDVPPEFLDVSASSSGASAFQCSATSGAVSCTTNGFAGRESKGFRISVTAPREIRGGSRAFTLRAQVDPENDVPERDNQNNSDNLTVSVETRPELTVTTTGSATEQLAPRIVAVVTARNAGDREATNVVVRSTLPKDTRFTGVEENQLGTCLQNSAGSAGELQVNCTVPSLPPGASRHVRVVGELVGTTPDGVKVTFAANVDPLNAIRERNETNNTAFLIATMRSPTDLAVTGTVSKSPVSVFGGPTLTLVELRLTVRNNGPGPAPATSVQTDWPSTIGDLASPCPGGSSVNLQRGTCVTDAQPPCFGRCPVPPIPAGQSAVVTTQGLFDPASGNQVVLIRSTVDPDGALPEAVVGNNQVTLTVSVP